MKLMDAYTRSNYQEGLRNILDLQIAVPDKHGGLLMMNSGKRPAREWTEAFLSIKHINLVAGFYKDYVELMT